MLTSLAEAAPRERPAYRSFRVQVARVERLAPHFTSVTFAGDDLDQFGTAGLDQRVKVVLPLPEIGFAAFPEGDDWYGAWRELPAELRNPFRTYTVRAVRPDAARGRRRLRRPRRCADRPRRGRPRPLPATRSC